MFIIGCGGKTHEIIRILASMCEIFQREMLVYILDEEKILEASFPNSFYFKAKDSSHKKAQKLAMRVN